MMNRTSSGIIAVTLIFTAMTSFTSAQEISDEVPANTSGAETAAAEAPAAPTAPETPAAPQAEAEEVDYSLYGWEYAYLWGQFYTNIVGPYFGYQPDNGLTSPPGQNGFGYQTAAWPGNSSNWSSDSILGYGYDPAYYYNPQPYDLSLYPYMGYAPYYYNYSAYLYGPGLVQYQFSQP